MRKKNVTLKAHFKSFINFAHDGFKVILSDLAKYQTQPTYHFSRNLVICAKIFSLGSHIFLCGKLNTILTI
jgi:hypothetical protein